MDQQAINENLNENSNEDHIPCECISNDLRPVGFLGDYVCKISNSSVREMIKRYEPDHEIGLSDIDESSTQYHPSTTKNLFGQSSGMLSLTSRSNEGFLNSIANIPVANTTQNRIKPLKSNPVSSKRFKVSNQTIYEEDSSNQSLRNLPIQEELSFTSDEYSKYSHETLQNNQNLDQLNRLNLNKDLQDASYKSRTTIKKTSHGIRITTDIFFDTDSKIPENWIVKRVETDIPCSKIIAEFQNSNNLKT